MWVRMQDGRVVEITHFTPTGLFHPALQFVAVPTHMRPWVTQDYVLTGDGVSPPSLVLFRDQLKAALASKRWQEETKGALVGAHRYHTDQASQAKLTAALFMGQLLEAANGTGSYAVTWKSLDGWVVLSLAALTTVALTCGAHVQQAYGREAAIAALIEAAPDWQSALQIYNGNINDGWPA
jgi:hypothetical protein